MRFYWIHCRLEGLNLRAINAMTACDDAEIVNVTEPKKIPSCAYEVVP